MMISEEDKSQLHLYIWYPGVWTGRVVSVT